MDAPQKNNHPSEERRTCSKCGECRCGGEKATHHEDDAAAAALEPVHAGILPTSESAI